MKKMISFLVSFTATWFLAESALGNTALTLPVPPKPTGEVVTGIRLECQGSLMDFAGPRDTTNGVSWVVNRRQPFSKFLNIYYINQFSNAVSSSQIPAVPGTIEATRAELISAGQALGLSWTGKLSSTELSACVSYAIVRKIGSSVITNSSDLDAWTFQVVTSAITNN